MILEIERRASRQLNFNGPGLKTISQQPVTALLEDIRSLWNVGSIFRTADGAGIKQIYLCGITGCPPRKEIAKTSLGAETEIAWQYFVGPLDALMLLRTAGITIVGLERTAGSQELTSDFVRHNLKSPMCLVVGNEVAGISAEVLDVCDFICHLPMRGAKESLNVAVAFGIAAYMLSDLYCS